MTLSVIFGGQFGSEGKGLIASYLAKTQKITLATTDAGPNAGHTAIWNGEKVVTFHLPMAGVLSPHCLIWLNGGSIINPDKLMEEVEEFDAKGFKISDRLKIHPNAAIIDREDIMQENDPSGIMYEISGTMKGVGRAAARKSMRTAKVAKDIAGLRHWITPFDKNFRIIEENVVVEVAQGFSLGINAGFYPHCTHRACTPAQGLMNAAMPTTIPHTVYAVIRVNPIRVGNTPSGYSGDPYKDQTETTWEALGLQSQYTTVTNRLRRVFTYSNEQVEHMICVCKPDVILINFAQTVDSLVIDSIKLNIKSVYDDNNWMRPKFLYGYGPTPEEVKDEVRGDDQRDMQRIPPEDDHKLPQG
jgi:adenylosuccinate synthase